MTGAYYWLFVIMAVILAAAIGYLVVKHAVKDGINESVLARKNAAESDKDAVKEAGDGPSWSNPDTPVFFLVGGAVLIMLLCVIVPQ